MATLKEQYTSTILPALQKELGKNVMELPKIEKITFNVGLSTKRDAKFIEIIEKNLEKITGQKPIRTKARKSESGFKLREGMVVGAKVTLRGQRMWDMMDKLVHVVFPRVRDFQGIEDSSVDSRGNFHYGFAEHTAFPEISADEVESLHGLQVTVTTTAGTQQEGLMLFRAFGFPFKNKQN